MRTSIVYLSVDFTFYLLVLSDMKYYPIQRNVGCTIRAVKLACRNKEELEWIHR